MKSIGNWVHSFLQRPFRVFVFCIFFALASLIFDKGFIRMYSLQRDKTHLINQTRQTQAQILKIEQSLQKAKDPAYIEREALDRYDFADEHDLVFVFSDQE